MKGFKPYNPNKYFPAAVANGLATRKAYFIDEVIDALDLRPFYQDYEGESRGQPPFDPAMLLTYEKAQARSSAARGNGSSSTTKRLTPRAKSDVCATG